MPRGRATPARSIILIVTDLCNCVYGLCVIKVISRKKSLMPRGRAAPARNHRLHHDMCVYLFIQFSWNCGLISCKLTNVHLYHIAMLLGCPWNTILTMSCEQCFSPHNSSAFIFTIGEHKHWQMYTAEIMMYLQWDFYVYSTYRSSTAKEKGAKRRRPQVTESRCGDSRHMKWRYSRIITCSCLLLQAWVLIGVFHLRDTRE